MGLSPTTWRALPDKDKDDLLIYLEYRTKQLVKLRELLIGQKKYSPEIAMRLYLEEL